MQWLGVSMSGTCTSVPPKPSGTPIRRIWRPSDWSSGDPPWGPLWGPSGYPPNSATPVPHTLGGVQVHNGVQSVTCHKWRFTAYPPSGYPWVMTPDGSYPMSWFGPSNPPWIRRWSNGLVIPCYCPLRGQYLGRAAGTPFRPCFRGSK